MKQITFIATLLVAFTMNAQFSDDFDAETDDSTQFANWNSIDLDGDGEFWEVANIDDAGTGAEMSELSGLVADSDSWEGTAFTPDNLLISKAAIDISDDASTLSFTMGTYQTNGTFLADRLQVYLTESDDIDDITAETPIFDMTVGEITTAEDGPSAAAEISLDISGFAGQSLFLSFRHFDSVDENSVLIDNLVVDGVLSADSPESISSFSYFMVGNGSGLRLVASSQMSDVTIYNILGQATINQTLSTSDKTIDISSLVSGVYVAQVTIDGATETFKILKN